MKGYQLEPKEEYNQYEIPFLEYGQQMFGTTITTFNIKLFAILGSAES